MILGCWALLSSSVRQDKCSTQRLVNPISCAAAAKSIVIEHILQWLCFHQLGILEADLTWKVLLNTQRKTNFEFSGLNIYSRLSKNIVICESRCGRAFSGVSAWNFSAAFFPSCSGFSLTSTSGHGSSYTGVLSNGRAGAETLCALQCTHYCFVSSSSVSSHGFPLDPYGAIPWMNEQLLSDSQHIFPLCYSALIRSGHTPMYSGYFWYPAPS